MSWSMVALIGPGVGPRIPISRKKAILRVSGREDGEVRIFGDGKLHETVNCNGNHALPDAEFVMVEYAGNSKTLIAEVIRET